MTDKPKSFTDTAKNVGIARSVYGLVRSVVMALIVTAAAILLMSVGLPIYIGIPIIAVFALIIVVGVIQYKRARSVDTKPVENTGGAETAVDPGEVLTDYIAGLRRYGRGAGSYSVLGTGRNLAPENSLLVTNKNIWAVTVPLEGAGKVISGADISEWQWLAMQKDIENTLKGMVDAMTLEDLVKTCGKCVKVSRSEIIRIKTADISQGVTFFTSNRRKYSYSIRNREDYEHLKKIMEYWI